MSKKKQVGPDKSFSLKAIEPKTPNQKDTLEAFEDNYNMILHGVAGTGKTFLSLWLGLNEVFQRRYSKVIILRSVVPSRDMGFLPGSAGEKMAVYEIPYQKICSELLGRGDAYEILKQKGFIEFITTSHIRGTTLNNAVVIVDEIQNLTFEENSSVLTRIGDNCRVILCGDIDQTDLYRNKYDSSGIMEILNILELMPSVYFIEFTVDDIVRSGFVKEFLIAKQQLNLNKTV